MKATYKEAEERMQKTLNVLANEFGSIRAGRANAAVLDRIAVDYYGVHTPVNQMAAISVPEARTLVITPWDATSLKAIEKAIQASDIGINPSNDGKSIRLMFPPLTEERRKDLVKEVHKFGEEAKIAIRSIRRDTIEKYKDMKKKSEITEDDLKDAEKDIQELTDKFVKEIDGMTAKKEKELLEV
jgi:ribosome recycling factor